MTPTLPFTGNESADAFLSEDPLALLIGFALDQQVTVQKAFSGPWELRTRLGHLDARRIAATDPGELDKVFRERPAIHRFPGSMAGKVAALCAAIAERYDNDASRIWREAADGRDLEQRLLDLPGIGPMKAKTILAVLGKRYGVGAPGHGRCHAEAPDPGRRRFGRGPGRVPGGQAGVQGLDARTGQARLTALANRRDGAHDGCIVNYSSAVAAGPRNHDQPNQPNRPHKPATADDEAAARDAAIRRVLRHGHNIDITTTGRKTGLPRRIEITFHSFDGHLYVSGMPSQQTRAWLRNLRAEPRFTFHLKALLQADLPATAREITDEAERREVLAKVARAWKRDPEPMVRFSPLIEVSIEGYAPAPAD